MSQLVDLSAAQDVEAGDGTTSVVVLAGAFLGAAEKMLQKGIHPTIIAESFLKASAKAVEYLEELSMPIDLNDKSALLRAATTSLNSKVRRPIFYPVPLLNALLDRLSILIHPRTYRCSCGDPPRYPYIFKC